MIKVTNSSLLDKFYLGLLLVVFGGIVVHAPLSVGFGSLLPGIELLIKSWKEILMMVAAVLAVVILYRRKQFVLLKDPLMLLIGGYALLHLLLVPLFWTGLLSSLAGLMIDLRYLLFFVLVYLAMRLYPDLRRIFLAVLVAGALVVIGFALLQMTILPYDVLKYIGYGDATIAPFLTVDQNMDYIRYSSTLRGPNPAGAYAVIILTLLTALILHQKADVTSKITPRLVVISGLFLGSVLLLWVSYSRSALLAAVLAVGMVLVIVLGRRIKTWIWIGLAVVALGVAGGLLAARDTDFVSNVILHEDVSEGNDVNSNEGHIESLQDGLDRMLRQPFGGGVGSTGSASLLSDQPLIIENQYLFIAHEVGWLGLALFIAIFVIVMKRLWQYRKEWLALGVFASGVGMALIGVLLPVWADDTVAIVWWGLAAIALEGVRRKSDGTIHKKTTRTA